MLYIHPVLYVRVYFAYQDGEPLPTSWSGPPSYGQLSSERVRGVLRLELWPLDFSGNTKGSTSVQPRCLWRPEVTAVRDFGLAFTGVEKVGRRWMVQRWMCEPKGLAELQKDRDARQPQGGRPEEAVR